jgi:hypothetical protein
VCGISKKTVSFLTLQKYLYLAPGSALCKDVVAIKPRGHYEPSASITCTPCTNTGYNVMFTKLLQEGEGDVTVHFAILCHDA